MRLLLDTHIWVWALLQPDRLGEGLVTRLTDPATELWLSPISVWEAMLLIERGRIEVDRRPPEWIRHALAAFPLRDAPLDREVAIASRGIDLRHEDPADRFLAATSLVHDLVLATADDRLHGGRWATLPNR